MEEKAGSGISHLILRLIQKKVAQRRVIAVIVREVVQGIMDVLRPGFVFRIRRI